MSSNQYYVYIITNISNTVLYIGITNDLQRRIHEHKNKIIKGFTQRYNINKLVYYEVTSDINIALAREKQLKNWNRNKKNEIINSINPQWIDLSI